MKIQRVLLLVCLTAAINVLSAPSASALPRYYVLPVDLAVEAATTAVHACNEEGYNVTATVVNREGRIQVVVRGDGATPHTVENSFNKAYTVITLGPVQKKDSTADIYKSMTPSTFPLGNWPMPPQSVGGLTFTPGGLAIKVSDQLVGGLGVAGAPGGAFDQGCAQKGIDKIRSRLVP